MSEEFNKKMRKVGNSILKSIFADKYNCIVCQKELYNLNQYGLCDECRTMLTKHENICNKCGRRQDNEADYCITCQNHKRYFDFARSSVVYEKGGRALVYGLKFSGKKYLAGYMSKMMVDTYLNNGYNCDVIIAVPLSKERFKKRGFNQSLCLAKEISYLLKLPIDNTSLIKVKDTPEQAMKSGKERELNVLDAYKVVDKKAIQDKRVLLIDDVLTTGATTSEVSKALYKAKAKSVQVLTFACTRYKVYSENLTDDVQQLDNSN